MYATNRRHRTCNVMIDAAVTDNIEVQAGHRQTAATADLCAAVTSLRTTDSSGGALARLPNKPPKRRFFVCLSES